MSKNEERYMITKQHCADNIHGVCSQCGGKLEPIETVDNSGNPTFWSGCEKCLRFDCGVPPEIYRIAKELVEKHNYHHYSHIGITADDDADTRQYKNEQQIGDTCEIVRIVINLYTKGLKKKKMNENLNKLLKRVYSCDTEAGHKLRYHIQRALACEDYRQRLSLSPSNMINLTSLFVWGASSEGAHYWAGIAEAIGE